MRGIRQFACLAMLVYASLLVSGVAHNILHHHCDEHGGEEHGVECLLAKALSLSTLTPEAPAIAQSIEIELHLDALPVAPVSSYHAAPGIPRGPPATLSV